MQTTIVLSDQQQAVVDAVARNDADVEVEALAGTGKSTTALEATKVARGDVTYFAFNKSIVNEMKPRAPRHVNVQTLHSFGFRILRENFQEVKLDDDKTWTLLDKHTAELHARLTYSPAAPLTDQQKLQVIEARGVSKDMRVAVKKLVSLVKNTLAPTDGESLHDLADSYDIVLPDKDDRRAIVFELVSKIIADSIPSSGDDEIMIDFDDMIWLPNVLNWMEVPQYDWVFVDEAQDLSAPQHHIVLRAAESGRICYIGDRHQAIYAFRGAHETSMDVMRETLEKQGRTVIRLPLTRTRRCPKKVVKIANIYVPELEALPEAPDGVVAVEDMAIVDPKPGDAVICRFNAPVVRFAYTLLRRRIPVVIQGRDIGEGVVTLVRSFKAPTLEVLGERLNAYEERERARLEKRHAGKPSRLEAALAQLSDKLEVVRTIAAESRTVDELITSAQQIFVDQAGGRGVVACSSIHRFKGKEAGTVYILSAGFDWTRSAQDPNVRYVAVTRPKLKLVFVKEERDTPIPSGWIL